MEETSGFILKPDGLETSTMPGSRPDPGQLIGGRSASMDRPEKQNAEDGMSGELNKPHSLTYALQHSRRTTRPIRDPGTNTKCDFHIISSPIMILY